MSPHSETPNELRQRRNIGRGASYPPKSQQATPTA
jgi:hypothetical protein